MFVIIITDRAAVGLCERKHEMKISEIRTSG
jgi:hypothetical protein